MRKFIAKKPWKNIVLEREKKFADDESIVFNDLVEFQELTDYVVEDTLCKKRKREENEEKSSKKVKLELEVDEKTTGDKKEKRKKKKSRSKKKKLQNAQEIDSQPAEVDEDDGMSDSDNLVVKKKKNKSKKKNLQIAQKVESEPAEVDEDDDMSDSDDLVVKKKKTKSKKTQLQTEVDSEPAEVNQVDGMSDWDHLFVPREVLKSLKDKNFTSPTSIQRLVLPSAIRDRMDIIGAAETGSGKTLAFAIPIIAHLLEQQKLISTNEDIEEKSSAKNLLKALIITPTRELALQIRDHIEDVTKCTSIKCAAVVGGMSIEKQIRLLERQPEVVIATPGRLWELIQQRVSHVEKLNGLKFLVIDEVDKMMEKNHFEELDKILTYVQQLKLKVKRQNFVFSATLTFLHKKPQRIELKKKKNKMREMTIQDRIASLQQKLEMSDKPKIVDLTKGQQMMAHTLEEKKINCSSAEKDIYIHYFIKSHPGRTLVFANSKDTIRRLTSLLKVLQCEPLHLHADMHQKQRLKNLDKFKESENGILLATDVAARGLDIPDVQYVIHYHVPRTAESYVHRSGRTARSNKDGLSVALVSPEEDSAFKKILISLKKEKDLSNIKVENDLFHSVSRMAHLARSIEKEEFQLKKKIINKNWIKQTAKECDIALSDEETDDDDKEAKKDAVKRRKLEALKQELYQIINAGAQPKRIKKK